VVLDEVVVARVLCELHVVFGEADAVPSPRLGEHEEGVRVVDRERVHALELDDAGGGTGARELVVTDRIHHHRRAPEGLDLPVGQRLLDASAGGEGKARRERQREGVCAHSERNS
jgi:hypothetical protein